MRITTLVYCVGLALSFFAASAARCEDGWARAIPPPRADSISAAAAALMFMGWNLWRPLRAYAA